ncbi:MAG: sel1 repeat family protein [Acholeplasmatales bacterium]|nr:MAG: sel1 repeat family protein [Acholeplasmatales bacterium]
MELEQLKHAASHGDVDAMVALGKMLMAGKKVSYDPMSGEKWLKKAARKKHPEALFLMGQHMLETHQSHLAITYLKRAERKGSSAAIKLLGHVYRGDFDSELRAPRKAGRYFRKYYTIDKFDALEPLLSLYDDTLFQNVKRARSFLEEARDYGLLKAQYHLACLILKHDKDYAKSIDLLENYYAATADAHAAKLLHALYDPKDKTYPKCPLKNAARAEEYLRQAIAADSQLEGTTFIHERPTYLPKHTIGVETFLNRALRRMKTSLAIEQTFAESLTREHFDTELRFVVDTISRVDATWSYRVKTVHTTHEEKTVQRKKKVKKGLKTTGTVKVTETVPIKKTQTTFIEHEHKETLDKSYRALTLTHQAVASLHHILTHLESMRGRFAFSAVPTEHALKNALHKRLLNRFKAPRGAKKVKVSFAFDYVYVLKPELTVRYVHGDTVFEHAVDLTDEQLSYTLPFPLDAPCAKKVRRFDIKQRALQKNQRFFSALAGVFVAIVLYRLFQGVTDRIGYALDVVVVIAGGLTAIGVYRLTRFERLQTLFYVDQYDADDFSRLKQRVRSQTLRLLLAVAIVLVLIGLTVFI